MRNTELTFNVDAAVLINKIVKLVSPGAASYEPGEGYVETSGAAGTGEIPLGVSHNAGAAADDPVRVVTHGEAYVKLGGTVAPGDPIKSDASGDGVKATGASQYIVGFALEDGVDNDIRKILVQPGFWTLA